MENQRKEKRISRARLSLIVFSIIMGWILDVLSSYVGLNMGLMESSSFFMIFPAGWMIMLLCLCFGVYLFPKVPFLLKGSIMLWIIAFSMLPSVRNTVLILEAVF